MTKKITKTVNNVTGEQLLSIIERVERLEEEKKGIGEDISQIFAEAKGNGFDLKVIRAILKERKADPNELQEFEAILSTYKLALGMDTE